MSGSDYSLDGQASMIIKLGLSSILKVKSCMSSFSAWTVWATLGSRV